MSLTNESVAVITGAASGIGRAVALRLASEKISGVAVCDVNREGLSETAEMLEKAGVPVSAHIIDVASRAQMENLVDEIIRRHGRVTHLINNAGVSLFGDVEEVSPEDIEWVMNINFWGVVNGVQLFLPFLRREPLSHIVNMSSVFGIIAPPGQAAYCASKFAVRGFSEALRHELEGSNVIVSTVHPGGVRTNIANNGKLGAHADETVRRSRISLFNERLARTAPADAAEAIVRGINRREPRILIGADARQISFLSRLFPQSYLRVMNLLSGGKLDELRQNSRKAG